MTRLLSCIFSGKKDPSQAVFSHLEEYFADRRWTERVDLVILFNVEPEVVLERDMARNIARQLHGEDLPGVITNESTLQTLRDCYREIRVAFEDRFNIQQVHTSRAVMTDLAKLVVEIIREEYEGEFGNIT